MTREEALAKIPHTRWYAERDQDFARGWLLDSLIELGLIKFDEPNPVEAIEVLITAIGAIDADIAITRLKRAGFKIVRA